MGNVQVLRLDRLGGAAQGNKSFKLRAALADAMTEGHNHVVSFGGAWSNHLHALAARGAELGLLTTGLVRGSPQAPDTATMRDLRALGMRIVRISRSEYRRRNDPDYLAEVAQRWGPCKLIPEGGSNRAGAEGCRAIAELILGTGLSPRRIVVAVGTGTTLAGIAAGLAREWQVHGVSALKGATDLDQRIRTLLDAIQSNAGAAHWTLDHNSHCGGFARASAGLQEFMLAFESVQGIPLEPVYTGKVMFAVHAALARGDWVHPDPVLVVHTGGLQGRRGYPWLS